MSGPLGCGVWTAFLQCRGGGELVALPFTDLTMNRRVDDMSDASVAVGHFTRGGDGTRALVPAPALSEECCGALNDLSAWEHEIALWRDDDSSWIGPVIKPVWRADTVSMAARDLFQWFERRLLEHDREFFGEDLADIFRQLCLDALHRDPSPHIHINPSATGILGDRTVLVDAKQRAADALRELLRAGLDMTMIGRTMIVGGTTVPTADLGTLITSDFDGLELTEDGLQTETESTVVGSSTDTVLGPTMATAGGVDARLGLVQNVVTESGIEDDAQCQAAADSRLALLAESPRTITGRLLPTAPVGFDQLIPGAVADLRLQLMCKEVEGDHRLQSVQVHVDEKGVETVNVVFTNLGTTGEAV